MAVSSERVRLRAITSYKLLTMALILDAYADLATPLAVAYGLCARTHVRLHRSGNSLSTTRLLHRAIWVLNQYPKPSFRALIMIT
jgi:hypothetical protein